MGICEFYASMLLWTRTNISEYVKKSKIEILEFA